jgi:hypothetical protein
MNYTVSKPWKAWVANDGSLGGYVTTYAPPKGKVRQLGSEGRGGRCALLPHRQSVTQCSLREHAVHVSDCARFGAHGTWNAAAVRMGLYVPLGQGPPPLI